jgi:hypothetical protein
VEVLQKLKQPEGLLKALYGSPPLAILA